MRLKIFCAVLLLQYCLCAGLVAQANISFTPQVDGELIDMVPYQNRLILVSSNGIYDLNLKETRLIQTLGEREIFKPLQNVNPQQKRMYYPVSDSSMVALHRGKLRKELQYGQGIYLKTTDGDRWLISDTIALDQARTDIREFRKFEQFNPPGQYYTDGATYENNILLSTAELGVVKISKPKGTSDYKVKIYNEQAGLLSNHCTSLRIFSKDHFAIGHPEGISVVQYGRARYHSLSMHATSPIIQVALDHSDRYWAATSDRIFLITGNDYEPLDLNLDYNEEIRKILVRPDNSLLVMTNSNLHIIPDLYRKKYQIVNKREDRPVSYYSIRNNKYYSDGKTVYCLDKAKDNWEPHLKKAAPQRIIKNDAGHTTLVFKNNKCLKLSDRTASRLSKFSIPDGEDLININQIGSNKYYCTGSNLYEGNNQHFKLINEENDVFYKVLETEKGGRYAFGAKGIYAIEDNEMTPLLASYKNSKFPLSNNQFATDGKLVTFNKQSIKIIDEESSAPIDVNVAPLEILDIRQLEGQVWVLSKKSLISLRKSSLLAGRFDIINVIPHYQELEQGTLEIEGDKRMVIVTESNIFQLKLDELHPHQEPTIRIAKVETAAGNILQASRGSYEINEADLPVTFDFCSDNYWTDNIKYSYHVNHNGKNSSEWKKENIFSFDAVQNGKFTLVAKYKDDIYGSQVMSDPILINVSGFPEELPSELSAGPNHTPFIVISLLLLCSVLLFGRMFRKLTNFD